MIRRSFPRSNASLVFQSKANERLEVTKLLYHDAHAKLQYLRERSFNIALQMVTVNLIALGGLIANKVALSYAASLLGSILLGSFNAAIIIYSIAKGRNFEKVKVESLRYKKILLAEVPDIDSEDSLKNTPSASFWRGSGIFIFAIAISCICTVVALWKPLIKEQSSSQQVNLKLLFPQKLLDSNFDTIILSVDTALNRKASR